MFIPFFDNNYFYYMPFLPPNCDKPPTVYSILNSIVNGTKEPADYTKIADLAKEGRSTIFNFTYPLTDKINKEDFECMILNHYMMRRIGYETVTAFRLQLNVKLNSIMPLFNKMFDAINGWEIFNDGESITRFGRDDTANNSNTQNTLNNVSETISDRRYSDTPQNQLEDVKNGVYIKDYNYDTNNDTSSSTGESNNNTIGSRDYAETIEKTEGNKIEILSRLQKEVDSVYELIFNKLDDLFYGLV